MSKLLSPERIEEIRYFNAGNAHWETQTWMSPAINQLLSHIDTLTEQVQQLTAQRDRWAHQCNIATESLHDWQSKAAEFQRAGQLIIEECDGAIKNALWERDRLAERVKALREALEPQTGTYSDHERNWERAQMARRALAADDAAAKERG